MPTESTTLPKLPCLLDITNPPDVAPMTKENTKLFLNCFLKEKTPGGTEPLDLTLSKPNADVDAFKGSFAFNVMIKRLAVCAPETKVTFSALAFLLCLCDSPGKVVMWAYALHRLSQKAGLVSMSTLADAFPVGFPTEKAQEKIWDAQKLQALGINRPSGGLAPDNAIDDIRFWS